VALNYGVFSNEINADAIEAHYRDALQLAFEPSFKAFTLKILCNLSYRYRQQRCGFAVNQ